MSPFRTKGLEKTEMGSKDGTGVRDGVGWGSVVLEEFVPLKLTINTTVDPWSNHHRRRRPSPLVTRLVRLTIYKEPEFYLVIIEGSTTSSKDVGSPLTSTTSDQLDESYDLVPLQKFHCFN